MHHTTLTQLEKEGDEGKMGKRKGKIPGGGTMELLEEGAIERPGKSTHETNILLETGQCCNRR